MGSHSDRMIQNTELRIRCADGVELPATLSAPAGAHAALVIGSAMGVPRQFYRRFAQYLAGQGIATLTFDYRGIADARALAADPGRTRLEDWGRLDLDAALATALRQMPGLPLFLAGHSCGGQLAGLSPHAEQLAGLIFVAASSPNVRQWHGIGRWFMRLWVGAVIPLATLGRWFPARRLGFSTVDIPAGVMRQWGRWTRSPRYAFSPEHGLDTARYRRLRMPALCYSFADDFFTPGAAADALLREYPGLGVTRRHLRPGDVGARAIGHLGYFRQALRDSLWAETADWIRGAAAARAAA